MYEYRYKLILAYDGTAYHGWQAQPDLPSVAGTIEKHFARVFDHPIYLRAASRTDAGVHALGQVAHIITPLLIDPLRMQRALNQALPHDIKIRSLTKEDNFFQAHRAVTHKTYWYHLSQTALLPGFNRYCLQIAPLLSLKKLDATLQHLVGTHDFRSFCTGNEKECTVRRIDSIKILPVRRFRIQRVSITGNGFLRHMIRRIMGAALDIASDPLRASEDIVTVLNQRSAQQTFETAPAHALCLYAIRYKQDHKAS